MVATLDSPLKNWLFFCFSKPMIPASLPLFQTASAAWHSSDASMRTFPLQIKKKWEKRGSWSIDIVFWIRYINIWSETAGGGGVLCSQICSFYTNLRVLTMPMFTTSWTVSPECCKREGPRNTGMTNRAIRSHKGGSNSLTSLSITSKTALRHETAHLTTSRK